MNKIWGAMFRPKTYSLRKSKQILLHVYAQFKKFQYKLSDEIKASVQEKMKDAQEALLVKERSKASDKTKELELLANTHFKRSATRSFFVFIIGLIFALAVALVIRQMWFEFMEIPSGSMRPTFKEKDRLVVSKTDFGLNVPFLPKQFTFDPDLVKRSGTIVFTGAGMDIHDVNTFYFYLIPGKKQFVKRLVGKPGDTLYFYGGKIYGIDKDGNDISHELQLPELEYIDHIPFISFNGNVETPDPATHGIYSSAYFHQMNQPVAKLYFNERNQLRGEMLQENITEYSDLWGFKNYASARILSPSEVHQDLPKAPLYLELKHHPSLKNPKLAPDEMGRVRPSLDYSTSIIPLSEEHMQTLFNNLYTARFIVKDGYAHRYGSKPSQFSPHLANVPNGTYEFYYGKAYKVLPQGITKELPSSHPIYTLTPKRLQTLFNYGIELDTRFGPRSILYPSRYAYFRDGDLYAMGKPLLKKDDPILTSFLEREERRASIATPRSPFTPFTDQGAPTIETIKQYGITVPEKSYLGLGDNHAMSSDSRDFGFIPQGNLRGSPDFIFWPPESGRFGTITQPSHDLFIFPRIFVWVAAGISFTGYMIYTRRRSQFNL